MPFQAHWLRSAWLLLLLIVVSVGEAHGAPLRWGFRGGLSAANFGGGISELLASDARLGADVGFVLAFPLAPGFSIQSGAGYLNKGARFTSEATDPLGNPTGTFDSVWKFDYVEVPVLLRADVFRAARVVPYLEAGPSAGIRLKGRFATKGAVVPDVELTSDMKTLDLGYTLGAGLQMAAGVGQVGVGVRFTSGFDDLYDLDNNLSFINRTWTFAVTWMK